MPAGVNTGAGVAWGWGDHARARGPRPYCPGRWGRVGVGPRRRMVAADAPPLPVPGHPAPPVAACQLVAPRRPSTRRPPDARPGWSGRGCPAPRPMPERSGTDHRSPACRHRGLCHSLAQRNADAQPQADTSPTDRRPLSHRSAGPRSHPPATGWAGGRGRDVNRDPGRQPRLPFLAVRVRYEPPTPGTCEAVDATSLPTVLWSTSRNVGSDIIGHRGLGLALE